MVFLSYVERREASYPAVGCTFDARCRRGFFRASLQLGGFAEVDKNQLSICAAKHIYSW